MHGRIPFMQVFYIYVDNFVDRKNSIFRISEFFYVCLYVNFQFL